MISGFKKKKGGGKDDGKVYECRFCSLKFCKSQALGGHMNRHRQGKLIKLDVYDAKFESLALSQCINFFSWWIFDREGDGNP